MMSDMTCEHVDIITLRDRVADDRRTYAAGSPFPHIVLDDVLTADSFGAAVAEFPGRHDPFWKGYLHINETKYSNTTPDSWGPVLQSIAREFCSQEFVDYLVSLTGIQGLLADWSMDGGGLHQTLRGGHLNIHADFSTHHEHENWARRVNILLYLNDEWREEWGGQLELWDKDMVGKQGTVTPKGNRMLVFTTSLDSFHGHPDPLQCPPETARRSMALYYFTEEESAVRKSTNYRARPQDGLKGLAIVADRTALDLYDWAKRRLGLSDDTVQGVMQRASRLRRRARPRRDDEY